MVATTCGAGQWVPTPFLGYISRQGFVLPGSGEGRYLRVVFLGFGGVLFSGLCVSGIYLTFRAFAVYVSAVDRAHFCGLLRFGAHR